MLPFLFFYDFHGFSAAAGDHIAELQMKYLMADGAVHIALLLCPDHADESAFQFHRNTSFSFHVGPGVPNGPQIVHCLFAGINIFLHILQRQVVWLRLFLFLRRRIHALPSSLPRTIPPTGMISKKDAHKPIRENSFPNSKISISAIPKKNTHTPKTAPMIRKRGIKSTVAFSAAPTRRFTDSVSRLPQWGQ